ncbi:hypothetical protein NX801_00265 [Streptomyces sp. LP05-1]|uniref:Uncharacterized protein n=1 Tax=Streptomyces pyxinae TaxID=2970734 RepID=A0ABT2C9Q0_9ACTN|nr:hypothetical protein [Streptomyces sp. LP05-1]MCS0634122.1 hypothetical protein [Streptomyces sp. LP05-1]
MPPVRFGRGEPPLTEAERNRARNLDRIFRPPRPRLRDRVIRPLRWLEELWSRYVRHRELHRALDALRARVEATVPPEWKSPDHTDRCLRRLRADFARGERADPPS